MWRCSTCRWPVEAQRHGYIAPTGSRSEVETVVFLLSIALAGWIFVVGMRFHTGEVLPFI